MDDSMIDDEINQFENFLFSENKENFIKKFIPDTESYYYFTLLHALETSGGILS